MLWARMKTDITTAQEQHLEGLAQLDQKEMNIKYDKHLERA